MSVQFVVNEKGQKTGVFLSFNDYIELLERVEDSEAASMLKKMREEPLETRSFDVFVDENVTHV